MNNNYVVTPYYQTYILLVAHCPFGWGVVALEKQFDEENKEGRWGPSQLIKDCCQLLPQWSTPHSPLQENPLKLVTTDRSSPYFTQCGIVEVQRVQLLSLDGCDTLSEWLQKSACSVPLFLLEMPQFELSLGCTDWQSPEEVIQGCVYEDLH